MIIDKGLFDGIVLQRVRNASDASINGQAAGNGPVIARVTDAAGKTLAGFSAKKIGTASRGKFSASLKGLPVGGPYNVSLRAGDDEIRVCDVYVGDVWILGGQSNMEGVGLPIPAVKPNKMVRAFYSDDKWDTAADPLHILHKAVDPVHAALGANKRKYRMRGPGMAFGLAMYKQTGVPQGLIACAHGGTSMNQWSPELKKLKGASLYGATLRRFEKNGGKVAGIVWYQGCSDARLPDAPLYTERMKKLVASFRRDLKNPKLPFVLVQIARVFSQVWLTNARHWNSIQEQQRLLPEKIANCLTVPAIDLPMDDGIHVSGSGQLVLGSRLADAMLALTGMVKGYKKPIELAGIRMLEDKYQRGVNIEISFRNVAGKLQADGEPSGFALSQDGCNEAFGVYHVELKGSKAILHTTVPSLLEMESSQFRLHYGFGIAPYCNIADSAGRSLPVFGPLAMTKPKPYTLFVLDYAVSGILPYSGKPDDMPYPNFDDNSCGWQKRKFNTMWFAERHLELQTAKQHMCYYATDVTCDEDMAGELRVGYDGPVKVWLDGKVIMKDRLGTNPGMPDKNAVKVSFKKGSQHRIVIALSSNGGLAWGISLRFLRHGVSAATLRKGPEHYSLPVFSVPTMKKSN